MCIACGQRLWASARMGHLEDWFRSWVPDSVYSAGGGTARWRLGILLRLTLRRSCWVLSKVIDLSIFVADVVKSCDTIDRGVLDMVLRGLGTACLGQASLL